MEIVITEEDIFEESLDRARNQLQKAGLNSRMEDKIKHVVFAHNLLKQMLQDVGYEELHS